MKRIATPYPVGVQPVASVMPGNCQYPWCEIFYPTRAFTTDGSEMVIRARVVDESGAMRSGTMHVGHTTLYERYGDRQLKVYDDGVHEVDPMLYSAMYGEQPATDQPADPSLDEILHTVPTGTIYVSKVEDLVRRLDVHEALIIKRAGGSARRTLVNVWRRMP